MAVLQHPELHSSGHDLALITKHTGLELEGDWQLLVCVPLLNTNTACKGVLTLTLLLLPCYQQEERVN